MWTLGGFVSGLFIGGVILWQLDTLTEGHSMTQYRKDFE